MLAARLPARLMLFALVALLGFVFAPLANRQRSVYRRDQVSRRMGVAAFGLLTVGMLQRTDQAGLAGQQSYRAWMTLLSAAMIRGKPLWQNW
jgi:hypothetical protein